MTCETSLAWDCWWVSPKLGTRSRDTLEAMEGLPALRFTSREHLLPLLGPFLWLFHLHHWWFLLTPFSCFWNLLITPLLSVAVCRTHKKQGKKSSEVGRGRDRDHNDAWRKSTWVILPQWSNRTRASLGKASGLTAASQPSALQNWAAAQLPQARYSHCLFRTVFMALAWKEPLHYLTPDCSNIHGCSRQGWAVWRSTQWKGM